MRAWSVRHLLAFPPRSFLAFAVTLVIVLLPLALPVVHADDLDEGVRRMAKQLRCPICESVSVADSPADLAIQMRALIRRKLEAGESDQQILDYFVAAYGDSVLLEPPRRGLGWVVWLGRSLRSPLERWFWGSYCASGFVDRGSVRRDEAPVLL